MPQEGACGQTTERRGGAGTGWWPQDLRNATEAAALETECGFRMNGDVGAAMSTNSISGFQPPQPRPEAGCAGQIVKLTVAGFLCHFVKFIFLNTFKIFGETGLRIFPSEIGGSCETQ